MTVDAVICLGSNVEHGSLNLRRALGALAEFGQVAAGHIYHSEGGYLNCVCILKTSLDFTSIYKETKQIEMQLGRLPEHKKQGRVEIDIDVVYYDSKLLRPEDALKNYFIVGYDSLKDVKLVEKE